MCKKVLKEKIENVAKLTLKNYKLARKNMSALVFKSLA